MRIVSIFDDRLYACQYEEVEDNEYYRLLNLWDDPEYIAQFYHDNQVYFERDRLNKDVTLYEFAEAVADDLDQLEDILDDYANNTCQKLELFFRPLHDKEYPPTSLSYRKRQFKYLRLYAIRLDDETFLITGGAIKITKTMQEHRDTSKELDKLKSCKRLLISKDVFDSDSFHDFVILE